MPTTDLLAALRSPWLRLALVLVALAVLALLLITLAPGTAPTRAGDSPWGQVGFGR